MTQKHTRANDLVRSDKVQIVTSISDIAMTALFDETSTFLSQLQFSAHSALSLFLSKAETLYNADTVNYQYGKYYMVYDIIQYLVSKHIIKEQAERVAALAPNKRLGFRLSVCQNFRKKRQAYIAATANSTYYFTRFRMQLPYTKADVCIVHGRIVFKIVVATVG